MRVVDDPVVGRVAYVRFFWEREESIRLFERDYSVRVRFRGDEDAPLEDAQRCAYAGFRSHRSKLLADAECAVHRYYGEIVAEYREMLGDDAERAAPVVTTLAELGAIITPTYLLVPRTSRLDQRVVGLICECTWDPSVGLGVRFLNEAVAEVGAQDVVL
ncbi:MAG: hypothetical protein MUF10_15700 [Thermoanaerobaculaceae bacterium]|jgi:hypothetical protein|nr:hypothetical protein [Thermoanaerobaculaceae bacterium]